MALLRPLDAEQFGEREAKHLLLRAGFGGTPEQVRQLSNWGLEGSVDRLLNVASDDDYPRPSADDFADDLMPQLEQNELMRLRSARRNQDEEVLAAFRMRRQTAQRSDRRQMRSMQQWWLQRMIETTRPLEEKMTLFWHGHFATSYRTTENSYHMFLQNQLFRKHALDSFAELLRGIVHDPAMLRYLNNHQNRKRNPNENLARELMELFSLGPGAYTERDIKEGARALTGYAFEDNAFRFRRLLHDNGQKRILGRAGAFDGDDFVRIILEQRACAEFICRKLYRFFVADIPDDSPAFRTTDAHQAIMKLAATLRKNQYTIAPVLRELFMSDHFFSDAIVGQRIKSPAELVVGAIRALQTPVRSLATLIQAMEMMGQALFFPPNVAGWVGERAWINTSTLYARQNVMTYLLEGAGPFARRRDARHAYDPAVFSQSLDADDVREGALRFLLATSPADRHHGAVRRAGNMREALILITAMPEYHLC